MPSTHLTVEVVKLLSQIDEYILLRKNYIFVLQDFLEKL